MAAHWSSRQIIDCVRYQQVAQRRSVPAFRSRLTGTRAFGDTSRIHSGWADHFVGPAMFVLEGKEMERNPERTRRNIAILHSERAAELSAKPNPNSRVGYSDPEVVALSQMTGRELVAQHNAGDGTALALLCEIADEEGWS